MALMYIPRQRSPWEQMLPGFVQNLMFNQMATSREDKQIKAKTAAAQAEELRGYQAAGWRQPEAQKPVIEIGGTGLVPPETGFEVKTQNGRQVLVQTRTPYGGEPQVQKASVIKTDKGHKPGTVDVFDSKSGRTYIYPTYVSGGKLLRGNEPIGEKRPSGLKFTQTPEGGIELVMGGGLPGQGGIGELSRGAKGQFQKELESTTGHYQQLERAMTMFKPQHHRWLNQGLHLLTKIKEKGQGLIPGAKVSPQEQKEFAEYTRYKKALTSSYAQRVHELGKGTLTKHETKIYGGALAQPGMSETEIIETAKENMVELQMSIARKRHYLTAPEYGESEGERLKNFHKMRRGAEIMSVSDFESMIDTQYARELSRLRTQNPQVEYERLKQQAKEMIKATFFGF